MVTVDHKWEVIGSWSICDSSSDVEWPWKVGCEGQILTADLLSLHSYQLI